MYFQYLETMLPLVKPVRSSRTSGAFCNLTSLVLILRNYLISTCYLRTLKNPTEIWKTNVQEFLELSFTSVLLFQYERLSFECL